MVRLSIAGVDSMSVAATFSILPSSTTNTSCHYGLQPDLLLRSATVTESRADEMIHLTCIMDDLAPATEYFYRVGDEEEKVQSFKSPPPQGFADAGFNFLVFGDMGVNHSAATRQQLLAVNKSDFSLFLHIGDISYADDHNKLHIPSTNENYWEIYDTWLDQVEGITSTVPYMVCPGNHDISCHEWGDTLCDDNQLNATAFRRRFRMPSEESGAGAAIENMWYSFDYGNAHVS